MGSVKNPPRAICYLVGSAGLASLFFGNAFGASSKNLFHDLFDAAQQHDPLFLQAQTARKRASLETQVVTQATDPVLAASANWGTQAGQRPASLKKAAPWPPSPGFSLGADHGVTFAQTYGITLSKVLSDGSKSDIQIQKSLVAENIAEVTMAERTEQLRYLVARVLARYLSAKVIQKISVSQLDIAQKKHQEIQKSYRSGGRGEADFVNSQWQLSRAQLGAQKATDDLALAWQILIQTTGLENTEALKGVEESLAKSHLTTLNTTQLNQLTSTLLQESSSTPGMVTTPLGTKAATERKRDLERQSYHLDIDFLRASQRPQIVFSTGAKLDGSLFPLSPLLQAQVQLNWNLPVWGSLETQILVANEKTKETALRDDADRKDRLQALARAKTSIQIAMVQLSFLDRNRMLQKKLRQLVKRRYDSGTATLVELNAIDDDIVSTNLDEARLVSDIMQKLIDICEARNSTQVDIIFSFVS